MWTGVRLVLYIHQSPLLPRSVYVFNCIVLVYAVSIHALHSGACDQRDACSSDVQRLCAEVPYQGGRLNQCLFDHVDKLSTACNRVMTQLMHEEIMALDVLPVVQDACHTQLRQYCRDVEPGEGRLFECLVKKRTGKAFDNRCQAALFSQQVSNFVHGWVQRYFSTTRHHIPYVCWALCLLKVLASEDVRFNAPLYKSCQESIPRLCADALPADGWRWMNDDNSVASAGDSTNDGSDTGGLADLHGKVLNCLIRRRDQITSFAREPGNRRQEAKFAQATQCRSHVAEAMKQIASDLRLNPELHESCFDDQKCVCRLWYSCMMLRCVLINYFDVSILLLAPCVATVQVLLCEHKAWYGLSARLSAGSLKSAQA